MRTTEILDYLIIALAAAVLVKLCIAPGDVGVYEILLP